MSSGMFGFLLGIAIGALLMGAHWCWHWARMLRRLRLANQWKALEIVMERGGKND